MDLCSETWVADFVKFTSFSVSTEAMQYNTIQYNAIQFIQRHKFYSKFRSAWSGG